MGNDITGSGPALTEADLAAFEERTARPIPTSYRTFLLEHNGGYPDPSDFTIKGRDNTPDLGGTVEQFLGIGVEDEYAEIERHLNQYADRIPADCYPIAQDPGGNIICLNTSGPAEGHVVFWDHEEEAEVGQSATHANIYHVADSFEAFLDGLTE